MRTILLLLASNCFMTYAWYGHLRETPGSIPLLKLILLSWGVAFFEYLFMVPANNIFGPRKGFSPFGLKTIQEIISLTVFAIVFLKVPLRWNHAVAFALIAAAAYSCFCRGLADRGKSADENGRNGCRYYLGHRKLYIWSYQATALLPFMRE